MAKKNERLRKLIEERNKQNKKNTSGNIRTMSTGLPSTRKQIELPKRSVTESVQALAQNLYNQNVATTSTNQVRTNVTPSVANNLSSVSNVTNKSTGYRSNNSVKPNVSANKTVTKNEPKIKDTTAKVLYEAEQEKKKKEQEAELKKANSTADKVAIKATQIMENIAQKPQQLYDGFQVKDALTIPVQTATSVASHVIGGVEQVSNSIAQTWGYGLVMANRAIGNEKMAERWEKATKQAQADRENTRNLLFDLSDRGSVLGTTANQVAEGYGQSLALGVTGSQSKALGNALTFGQGFGNSLHDSYAQEDVEDWQALLRATGHGFSTYIAENAFENLGYGGSKIDDALQNALTKKFNSGFSKALARTGISATGEALEEIMEPFMNSKIVDNLINVITEKVGHGAKFDTDLNAEELAESALIGFLSGGFSQGSATISNNITDSNIAISQKEKELGRKLTSQEKAEIKEETLLNSEKAKENLIDRKNQIEKSGLTKFQKEKITEQVEKYNLSEQDVQYLIDNTKNGKYDRKQATTMENKPISNQSQQVIQTEGKIDKKAISLKTLGNDKYSIKMPNSNFKFEKTGNVNEDILDESMSKYFNNSSETKKLNQTFKTIMRDKGIAIKFDENVTDANGNIVDGKYENGVMTINPNSERAFEYIATHELTHAIGTKQMIDMVERFRESDIELEENVKTLLDSYAEGDITEEALADISAQLFGTQEFISNVKNTNPNLFQKIYNEIKYLWHQFRGYKNQNEFIDDLYHKWTKAYNSNAELNQSNKYLFGSINAKNANIATLNIAKSMENNATPEEIWKKTGWFKGNEGKWRFEIYDKDINVNNKNINLNQEYKLEDILLNATELLNNVYPQLKNSTVVFLDTLPDNISGGYASQYKNYIINSKLLSDKLELKKTLLHEIQHQIQEIEGFSEGNNGNWGEIQAKLKEKLEKIDKEIESQNKKINLEGYIQQLIDSDIVIGSDEYWNAIEEYQKNSRYGAYISLLKQEQQVLASLNNKIKDRNPDELYENTAGEQEAKNVEERAELTKEEREALLPFVKNSETVYNIKDRIKHTINGREYDIFLRKDVANGKNSIDNTIRDDRNGRKNTDNIESRKDEFDNRINKQSERIEEQKQLQQRRSVQTTKRNENQGLEESSSFNLQKNKEKQLEIIQKTNSMQDDYHVGIRTVEDIKTFEEAMQDDESFVYGDFSKEDAEKALERGIVTVYSSKPIENGGFVSTSRNMAKDYAGSGKIYSKEVPLNDVAWINGDEGQYAKVDNAKYLVSTESRRNIEQKIDRYSRLVEQMQKEGRNSDEWAPYANEILRLEDQLETGYLRQGNKQWQEYLEKNFKSEGTRTYGKDIKADKYVTDNNGKVLELYHGSPDANITNFESKKSRFGKNGLDVEGIFFTNNPNVADEYSNETKLSNKIGRFGSDVYENTGKKGKVYKANLKMNKPFDLRNASIDEIMKYYKGELTPNEAKNLVQQLLQYNNHEMIRRDLDFRKMQADGYDGYIDIMSTSDPDTLEYLVFDGKQVDLIQPKKVSEVLKPKKKISEVLPKQEVTTTQAEKRQLVDEVYREDIAEGKVRKHYKSVFDSDQVGKVGKDVAKELLKKDTYVPISNLETITAVNDNISRNGIGATYNAFRTKVRSNEKITLQDVATGERLIQIYSQKGDYDKVNELIQDVAILGTELGQQVQALSLIKRASPEGQLQYLTKLLERTNIKENTNIKITDEMTEKILGAKNQEDLEKKLTEVAVELAEQLPVSKGDMIRSWRYLSMLGNPKTHIKNLGANVAMNLTQRAKNAVAGAIEGVASVFNPEMERTKTIKFANREQKQFAKQDAELMKDLIDAGGKYDVKNVIQESKKQFNNKVLNAIAEFNSNLLDKEDKIFLKSAYKMAMQNYMSANNLKASDMEGKTLEKARQYASLQAQEATFHEFNEVAQHLSQIENKGGLVGGAMSAILPFKKTPMNIAKAGVQYSPVGLASAVTYDIAQIAKKTKTYKQQLADGKITEAEYKAETSKMVNKTIDNMAKGLTGTSLAVLGYALAKMGVLKAGNDGEDDEFKQKLGEQEYAITIGDNTYTLDWVSPSAIPMFTGASIYQLMTGDVEDQKSVLNSTLTAFSKTFEPMTDMSMLQGLTSAITSYEQGSSNMIFDLGASMVTSYAGQFVPTVAGQVARIADPYERDTSSTKKGIEGKVDKFAKQTMNKIPGLSRKLPKKTDVWGEDVKRPENLVQRTLETAVLPWTRKSLVEDRTAQELLKVFDESGENVLPGNPNKDLTINKIKYRLTTEEYNEAKRNFGQTSKALLDDLFKSKTYNTLTAEGKAKAIDDVYAYAKEKIKVEYAEDNNYAVKPTNLYNTISSLEENNADVSAYFEFKGKIDDLDREKGEESVKNKEKMSYLKEMKTDAKTKRIIYEDTLGTNDEVYQNLSKLTGNKVNINQYLDYKTAEIKGIDDPNSIVKGKTKSGSKKANLQKYLRESNFSEVEALYIYGTQNSLNSTQRVQITNYINKAKQAGRLTASEEKELYKKLKSVEELENGQIRWK